MVLETEHAPSDLGRILIISLSLFNERSINIGLLIVLRLFSTGTLRTGGHTSTRVNAHFRRLLLPADRIHVAAAVRRLVTIALLGYRGRLSCIIQKDILC